MMKLWRLIMINIHDQHIRYTKNYNSINTLELFCQNILKMTMLKQNYKIFVKNNIILKYHLDTRKLYKSYQITTA